MLTPPAEMTAAPMLSIRSNPDLCGGTRRYFDDDGIAKARVTLCFNSEKGLYLVGQHGDCTYSIFKKIGDKMEWVAYGLNLIELGSFGTNNLLEPQEVSEIIGQEIYQV